MWLLITTGLNEPLTLARSFLFISWVFLFAILKPDLLRIKSRWILSLAFLPFIYLINIFVNGQSIILGFLGNYNRNFGIFTLTTVAMMVIYIGNSTIETKKFLQLGVLPTFIFSIFYSFIQSNDLDPIIWSETDRTVLTLGNSDYAAALLGVLMIIPVYYCLELKNKFLKLAMLVPLIATWRAGINSQAYQFRVLAVLSVTVFLLIYFWPKIQKISVAIRGIAVVVASSGVAFFVLSNRTELISRTSLTDRISQQNMGLRIFSDHPIFGVGIDQFWRFIPQYLQPADIQRNGSLVVPDKTHNLIIDHLAMGGILAGLAFTIFLVYSLFITYKLNRLGAELKNRNEFALLSGIWITYVIHLFISTDNLFMMAFGYASFGLIAQAYYANYPTKSKEGKVAIKSRALPLNAIRISAAVVLLLVSIVNIKALLVDAKIKKIVTNQVQSGDEIIQTLRSFPNPKTSEQVIVYMLQNLQNCPLAIMASDDLLKLDNRSAQAWYFKTICSDASNDQKTALTYIEKSLELQPLNLIYWDAKVRLEVRLKDFNAARNSVEQIRSINPEYASLKDLENLISTSITG